MSNIFRKHEKLSLLTSGVMIGLVAVVLVKFGNPKNMGFCIACFLRDISGSLGLHQAGVVQYFRPEIIGLVLGSFIASLRFKEFRSRSGSSVFLRFIISVIVAIGALMFLGCPLRMVLRLSAGDMYAFFGLIGFGLGIGVGCFFLSKGFSLSRQNPVHITEGVAFPALNVMFLILLVAVPSIFLFSEKGPGSQRAPLLLSILAGILVGILSQRSRFCMAGGIRDVILLKDTTLIIGFAGVLIGALVLNLSFGYFNFGFKNQPIVNTSIFYSILGMFVVGFGSILLGGCPLRQIILAGEGSSDSAISVVGMVVGGAIAHNFKLVGNAGGTSPLIQGKIAIYMCIAILLVIASVITFCKKERA